MGTRRSHEPGATAKRVRTNLVELRRQRLVSLRTLSARLDRLGHPLLASGLSKLESGTRRADVEDLVALALALDVAPNRLLLTGMAGDERIELTSEVVASESTVWRWATGEAALPVDLWADKPAAIDLDRARRFRRENRPHDHSDQTLFKDVAEHREVLAPAIRACMDAVSKSGLSPEDVLSYVSLAFQVNELAGKTGEGGQRGKRR